MARLEIKIDLFYKSNKMYPLVPGLYPKNDIFLALEYNLFLFSTKVDANARQPKTLKSR